MLYEKKLSFLFILLLSFFIMVSLGSRGAIASILVYMIIYFTTQIFLKTVLSEKIKVSVLFVITALVIINYKYFLFTLNQFLQNFGIDSRTIDLLLLEDLHLSGREHIYTTLISFIRDNPLKPHGLFFDRILLNGLYAHNIFLELIINFGFIVGILFSLLIVLRYINLKFDYKRTILLDIYFCIGFIPLLFSGSYLTDYNFWIFLGLAFSSNQTLWRNRID